MGSPQSGFLLHYVYYNVWFKIRKAKSLYYPTNAHNIKKRRVIKTY